VIPWPGFNFLELYPRFAAVVERRYRCVLHNARLHVYALHQQAPASSKAEIAVHA
jgi:hypothetical protein